MEITDQAERLEALNPELSFIVQAPAGSGKTGLLIQRFLMLLTTAVDSPEECLAITFTRKAASEMKDRVLAALQEAQQAQTSPSHSFERQTWELAKQVCNRDKALGWDLLNNPHRLKIQTIDAFCLGIARQMPIMSAFGSVPQIMSDASPLYQMAAKNLLKSLELEEPWSFAVSTLLEHLDNNLVLVEELLAEVLSHRDQWLPYIGQTLSRQQARQILESSLKGVVQESLNALVKNIPAGFDDIVKLAQFAANQLEQSSPQSESKIRFCKTLIAWPSSDLKDLSLWQGLSELFLTQEYVWRKTVTEQQGFPAPSGIKDKADKQHFQNMKAQMRDYLSRLESYPAFRENLQQLCECPPLTYSDHQWKMVETLVQLLPVLTAELSLVFQEHGQVDFVEVSLNALRALGEWDSPTELALGLDYKIRHLLVDEFQDTSLTQFRLLEKLTEGWQPGDSKTLFLVGDPMQSIYRFRQAEVGLFLKARQQGIGAICLKSLILTTNFRSQPCIVEWSNQVFKKLFPTQDNIVTSAIIFSPSKAVRKDDTENYPVHPIPHSMVQSVTVETEAEVVVDLVKSVMHASRDQISSTALLVRSRSHLQNILPALRQASIEYQGVQLELLSEHPIVQDLLGLTRALLHLGDRIAWLAILRAPWCSLSFKDLWIIANKSPNSLIWSALQTLTELSEEGKSRLEVVVPILSNALEQQGRLPLRAWVAETWIALGGPSFLADQNSLQDAEAFFAILEEENQFNFYEVGALEKRLKSLFAKPKMTSSQALQIMTIHQAKGLEFDTVIVPGIGRKSLTDPKKLLLWEASTGFLEHYLIVAPIQSIGAGEDPIYNYLRKQEACRAEHEMMRLWYVAATRARKNLYWLTHNTEAWHGA
jgi:ATP-dependent helicase/nuclease subunit A